jgi:hypothetical protein
MNVNAKKKINKIGGGPIHRYVILAIVLAIAAFACVQAVL